MKPNAELVQAIDDLDATRKQMRQLMSDQPANWKTDYAKLRPVFQEQTARSIGLTDAWLRQKGDQALLAKYREMVNHASARLAAHQARYPVLVLDGNNPDYIASFKEVNTNFDRILAFVREAMRS